MKKKDEEKNDEMLEGNTNIVGASKNQIKEGPMEEFFGVNLDEHYQSLTNQSIRTIDQFSSTSPQYLVRKSIDLIEVSLSDHVFSIPTTSPTCQKSFGAIRILA